MNEIFVFEVSHASAYVEACIDNLQLETDTIFWYILICNKNCTGTLSSDTKMYLYAEVPSFGETFKHESMICENSEQIPTVLKTKEQPGKTLPYMVDQKSILLTAKSCSTVSECMH